MFKVLIHMADFSTVGYKILAQFKNKVDEIYLSAIIRNELSDAFSWLKWVMSDKWRFILLKLQLKSKCVFYAAFQ